MLAALAPAWGAPVPLGDVAQVAAGGEHACALTTSGGVLCWGANHSGQLGDGDIFQRSVAGPVAGLANDVVSIAVSRGVDVAPAAPGHSCAVTSLGAVKCWGANHFGQLGDGTASTPRLTPVDVVDLPGPVVAVSAGWHHTCAVLASGALACWGRNDFGQLGDGTTVQRLRPTLVAGLSSGVAQVAAGAGHTCALVSGGVQCWGTNSRGELGDGTTTPRATPGVVLGLAAGVDSVSVGGPYAPDAAQGGGFSCAVTSAGGVQCWGNNEFAEIGEGPWPTPFEVTGFSSGVLQVSAGGGARIPITGSPVSMHIAHTCALTAGGGVKCWGSNYCGLLGRGESFPCGLFPDNRFRPEDVLGFPTGTDSISTGGLLSCAVTTSRHVHCWGGPGAPLHATPVLAGKQSQMIFVSPLYPFNAPPLAIGQTRALLLIRGSSFNPLVLTNHTPGICSLSGEVVTALATGNCEITVNQAGNDYFEAAPPLEILVRTGGKMAQSITFDAVPPLTVGRVAVLDGVASSGLPVQFASNTPSVCSVAGNVVTGLAVGSCTVVAQQFGNFEYSVATQVPQDIPVGSFNGISGLGVTVSGDGAGTVSSSPAGIACPSGCGANFSGGTSVTLTATPAPGSSFIGWTGACTGMGACTVTMGRAASVEALFVLPPHIPRLGNISTRAQSLAGDGVMIGGFVIGGSSSKTVVVRARGPSLVPSGIANPLANPQLQLVRSSDGATLATNDDWQLDANANAIAAAGFAPPLPPEAAVMTSLPPGAYTAIVSGAGGGTGVGIVEVFEVDQLATPLVNISTRGHVFTGDAMIGGFVIQGGLPRTVVVRARGPSLAPFGIANPLPDPQLTLVRSSDGAILAGNDNWTSAANAGAIGSAGFAPAHLFDSAILVTLPPGAYTAIVSGVGGATGVAIVEVFAVP